MSRNKRTAALILALILLIETAYADSSLIRPEDITADEVNYKTSVAEKGEMIKTVTAPGYEYYPLVTPIRYRGDTAVYGEWLVKRGDEVAEGDQLLKITVLYDVVAEKRLELSLKRTKQSFEEGKLDRQNQITLLQEALATQKDEYAKKIASLQIQKANIELQRYIYQQEHAISSLETQLDEMKERHASEYICAPCSGVVGDTTYFKMGDRIWDTQSVGTIIDQSKMLVGVNSGDLRYGMPVTIETGVNKDRTTVTGKVVAASDCLPDVSSNYALVEIDPFEGMENQSWKNMKVTGNKIYLGNVLMVSRKASVMNGGKFQVTKLSDEGITQKRYVIQGLTSTDAVWIVQGLEEGETVIID